MNSVYLVSCLPDKRFILAGGAGWMNLGNVVDVVAVPKVFQVEESIWRVFFSFNGGHFVSGSCWDEGSGN